MLKTNANHANMHLYHVSWKNTLQVNFERSDWLFTKIAPIFERIELRSRMRAHFLAFEFFFPTVYYTYMLETYFKIFDT